MSLCSRDDAHFDSVTPSTAAGTPSEGLTNSVASRCPEPFESLASEPPKQALEPCVEDAEHSEEKFTLWQTIGLNSMNMFGTGPFITIPLVIASCRPAGPQALIAYSVASLGCLCDALIWGDLGARWPHSGATYVYLKELYGPDSFGPLVAFLFIWQFFVTSPANIASGFIAIAKYLSYITGRTDYWTEALIAAGCCFLTLPICYRPIGQLGKITMFLSAITVLAVVFVLALGFANVDLTNYHTPSDAFERPGTLFWSFAVTCRLGIYDYTGYYDVNMMADEVERPKRTIPISVFTSCALTAAAYFAIYFAVLGSFPWDGSDGFTNLADDNAVGVMSVLCEMYLGRAFANVFTVVVSITIFASNFSMLTGFAYIPYAAARDGYFFNFIGKSSQKYPGLPANSLLMIWFLSLIMCFFSLELVIDAMTCLMLLVMFLGQSVGLVLYRFKNSPHAGGFNVPLYPLPVLIQIVIFSFIFVGTENYVFAGGSPVLELSFAFLVAGIAAGLARAWAKKQWPFERPARSTGLVEPLDTNCRS